MAITCTASVVGPGGNTSTVIVGQNCTLLLSVTNSNSTAQNVSTIVPYARVTSSANVLNEAGANFGELNIGPNSPYVYIPSGGTLVVPIPVTFTQSSSSPPIPVGTVNSGTQNSSVNSNNTYDVGATLDFTDANTPATHTIVSPTATTVTVSTIALPCSN